MHEMKGCHSDSLKPVKSIPKSSVEIGLAEKYEGLLPARKICRTYICHTLIKKRLQNVCDKSREDLCGWVDMKRYYIELL